MLKKVVYYFQQYLQWVIPQRQSWGCWELEDPSGEAPSETFRDGREDFPSEENLQTWELPLPSSHRAGLWHRPGEGCQRYPAFKLHPLRLPATQADQPQTGTLLLGHRLGRHPRYVEHQGCFYTSPFSFQLIIVLSQQVGKKTCPWPRLWIKPVSPSSTSRPVSKRNFGGIVSRIQWSVLGSRTLEILLLPVR